MSTKKSNTVNSKPKKSKNDLFRTAVGIYLKQKNYVGSEKFRKSDFMLLQNKKQFVFQKMLESDLHGGNCFGYSNVLCITNNQQIVDQQFGRFSQFVESQDDVIRQELRRLYGPMLCHLYLELLKAREQRAAVDFLKKYAHLVAPVETYDAPLPTKINGCSVPNDGHVSDAASVANVAFRAHIRFAHDSNTAEDGELEYFIKLIQTLSACTKLETAENDADITNFRSSKYEIHTTEAVVDALSTYLEKRGHVLILNLLYTWVHVHIIDNEVGKWTEDNLLAPASVEDDEEDMDVDRCEVSEMKSKTHIKHEKTATKRSAEEALETVVKTEPNAEVDNTKNERSQPNTRLCLQTLAEMREQLLRTQLDYPRVIKVAERCRGLTSAHVDSNDCHLACGFNSSIVQLWQLDQQTCTGKNQYKRTTQGFCNWELNNCSLEDVDQIDNDIKIHSSRRHSSRAKNKYEEAKYEDNSYNEYGGIQLRGHGLGVTDVRFSSHYPLLYSVSKDCTMRSWRAENYCCAAIYHGHRYPIWCLDESPVGMYMATGSRDFTARLWSLEREFPLITYAGHTQDVECIAFHPNGNYLATGSADLSVRLWCVTSGKLMRIFSDCKQPVSSIVFSPDGKMLAVGGEETKIRIFDIAGGSQLNELKDHTASVTSICWSSNSRHIATACRDGSLRLWDVKKLTAMNESSSNSNSATNSASTSASSSTAVNRLISLNSNCQRLLRVYFSNNETLCCVGGIN